MHGPYTAILLHIGRVLHHELIENVGGKVGCVWRQRHWIRLDVIRVGHARRRVTTADQMAGLHLKFFCCHFHRIVGLGMSLIVHFQIALCGEASAAHITFEWSFASVRTQMNLQCRIGTKHFATISASIARNDMVCFLGAAIVIAAQGELVDQVARQQALRCRVERFFGTPL